MKAYIKAIEYYLPEKTITNKDISKKFPEWSEEKIYSKVGIRCRHIATEGETALDMAKKAADQLFKRCINLKQDIDFLIFCTQSQDYKLPTGACILQDRLRLGINCGSFDFNLGCSGYVYGLSIAKGLIISGQARNVLLLTGETYSKYIHPDDKGNICIFGDAASATVVSSYGFAEIGEFVFGSDGSGFDNLIVKTGGARNPDKLNEFSVDNNKHIISSDYLYMDGESIFSFTLKQVPKMVKMLIEKSSTTMDDIDLFIFHQANTYILEFLRKKLKIDRAHFYYYIENVGNTVSNTIPIALCNAIRDGSIKGRKNIILAGFGVGLSWCGCMCKIVEGII